MKQQRGKKLALDLSDPGAIDENTISTAAALLRSGRLHRYGEYGDTEPHAALLEQEFAEYVGSHYAVGINSGGCALFIALKIAGIKHGDKVLVNAFNLAPVPGAIEHAGGVSVLVEINADYLIDLEDLEKKAATSGAKLLLLTHMRGHIADMDAIVALCKRYGITLIEDCAHTMGAKWGDTFTGRFGAVGCFSTQTFKHINSGEGGLLISDDAQLAAQAILYTGSYMLYGQHRSKPSAAVFAKYQGVIPNFSMRMSNLVACLLRPQLREMPARAAVWNRNYRRLEARLNQIPSIAVPERLPQEAFVASSIQFAVAGMDAQQIEHFVTECTARGVAIKWFGRAQPLGYTSLYQHWEYLTPQALPQTTAVLQTTCDMRIPLSLTVDDCDTIAAIITETIESQFQPLRHEFHA